jgi:hypothetical protein
VRAAEIPHAHGHLQSPAHDPIHTILPSTLGRAVVGRRTANMNEVAPAHLPTGGRTGRSERERHASVCAGDAEPFSRDTDSCSRATLAGAREPRSRAWGRGGASTVTGAGAAVAQRSTRDPNRRSRDPTQSFVVPRDTTACTARRSRASAPRSRARATAAYDTVPADVLAVHGTRATGQAASDASPDPHGTGVPAPHAVRIAADPRPRSRDQTPRSGLR